MTAACCQHCGQPLLQRDRLSLPPLKARILDLVQRNPGVSAEVLRGLVWADDPNGGPEDRKVLHVHINQANRVLAAHGLRIRGSRSFGYRLEKL
jgi:DNA-binding response OmpR family regulator